MTRQARHVVSRLRRFARRGIRPIEPEYTDQLRQGPGLIL
jgi:hypothetical protein